MQLKTFNITNTSTVKKSVPNIGVNEKSGTFRFNRGAVELMKLKAGNQVVFHQDEENPGDWYLEVVKSDGFELRSKKVSGPDGLLLQSCALARNIFESVEYSGKSGNILIGAEPVKHASQKLWPLITAKLVTA